MHALQPQPVHRIYPLIRRTHDGINFRFITCSIHLISCVPWQVSQTLSNVHITLLWIYSLYMSLFFCNFLVSLPRHDFHALDVWHTPDTHKTSLENFLIGKVFVCTHFFSLLLCLSLFWLVFELHGVCVCACVVKKCVYNIYCTCLCMFSVLQNAFGMETCQKGVNQRSIFIFMNKT